MKPDSKTKLLKIGWVAEPRALRGQLKIRLSSGDASFLDQTDFLQLQKKDSDRALSFAITFVQEQPNFLVVKLDGIDDRTMAESWVGADVLVPEELFVTKKSGDALYLRELLGFRVFDGEISLGPVIDFESNTSQDLLVVDVKDDKNGDSKTYRALIPLIKEFIVKIDNEKKEIRMNLPPGLLEVNREV